MLALRQLHEASKHPWLFHCARKSLWEAAKSAGQTYYPPTYEQDGSFTHATADASKLVEVLNHFYRSDPEEWVALRMTNASLATAGVSVTFEETAPVGDTPAIDMGDQLFPHIQGGIPTAPGVVLQELPVKRAADGTYIDIPGMWEAPGAPQGCLAAMMSSSAAAFGAGALAGGLVVGLAALRLSRRL